MLLGEHEDEMVEHLAELEAELEDETESWTVSVLVRGYASNDEGLEDYEDEALLLADHGYLPTTQSVDGGHVHVGRLLLTAGLSVLAGKRGIRSDGTLTVTFRKTPDASTSRVAGNQAAHSASIEERLTVLKGLRDAGQIDDAEYKAQRARILGDL